MEKKYRIECRDYSSRYPLPLKDYSGKPPSSRTSHSHGIRLYARNTSQGATPTPLAELVRFGLAGVLARINSVSHVVLHDDNRSFKTKEGEVERGKKREALFFLRQKS